LEAPFFVTGFSSQEFVPKSEMKQEHNYLNSYQIILDKAAMCTSYSQDNPVVHHITVKEEVRQ